MSAALDIPIFSASQITLWKECQRKWAWRYIAGLTTPQHPAAALGTEVDDTQLQPYLVEGRPFDFTRESGHIAAAGLAWLPKPKTHGLECQKHFVMPSPTKGPDGNPLFGYQGYLDLWLPHRGLPDVPTGLAGFELVAGRDVTIPQLGDFKTTGDVNKWAKDEGQLSTDVQAQLYATWAMWHTKARTVDLAWIYFQTRGAKKTRRTWLRVDGDHVFKQFKSIDATGAELYAAKTSITDPLDLPPNAEACEAYGGCPYRHKCDLSPAQIIESMAAQANPLPKESLVSTTDLLADLKRKRLAALGGTAPAADTPAPAAETPAPAPTTAPGVNPPETNLPPAPAVGTGSPAAVEEKTKTTRAPRKPKTDAAGAGVADLPAHDAGTSFSVLTWAGKYEITVPGVVVPGESLTDAIRRVRAALEPIVDEAKVAA